MSRFFSQKYQKLTAYTPGEQPQDIQYIKLNTNESPYPPSGGVCRAVVEEIEKLQLYSDPSCRVLTTLLAEQYGVQPDQILVTNGSDEILNFAFMAYGNVEHPFAFPDITYGFYPVFAKLNGIPYREIPLKEDFSIDVEDYVALDSNIVIANPNAPTGISLSPEQIEKILSGNPDHIVIIDEAYIDFGGTSCIPLLQKYRNLLITQTFSKSRSMAGARLGFGIGNRELIADLNTIKYSTNPYNINRMSMAAGIATLQENSYYRKNCKKIMQTRSAAREEFVRLGFHVLPSDTNFLFVRSDRITGEKLYTELKRRGILVRHFSHKRINDYNRITVGTPEQMQALFRTIRTIFKEENL